MLFAAVLVTAIGVLLPFSVLFWTYRRYAGDVGGSPPLASMFAVSVASFAVNVVALGNILTPDLTDDSTGTLLAGSWRFLFLLHLLMLLLMLLTPFVCFLAALGILLFGVPSTLRWSPVAVFIYLCACLAMNYAEYMPHA